MDDQTEAPEGSYLSIARQRLEQTNHLLLKHQIVETAKKDAAAFIARADLRLFDKVTDHDCDGPDCCDRTKPAERCDQHERDASDCCDGMEPSERGFERVANAAARANAEVQDLARSIRSSPLPRFNTAAVEPLHIEVRKLEIERDYLRKRLDHFRYMLKRKSSLHQKAAARVEELERLVGQLYAEVRQLERRGQ